ncbi:MAG: 23S rRNA (uracil(1939)-C(5))-methyltransferase RlmD [Coriobacteriia bacterium]|nr:23S rRNA (uracil(1939)-C(5))-methyltransferase RlmD [Coriobacteriia bacterium]
MDLTVESLAYGGAGVARAEDGVTVFVDGSCPGDIVRATITEDHGRFRKAVIDEVLTPSKDRVTPRCTYFGECGGCQWQHVDYGTQLQWKRRAIADALERIGKLEVPVREALGSTHSYGYRNKIELSATSTPQGLALGYSRAGSARVLPVERCPLLPKKLERAPRSLTGALRYLSSRGDTAVERVALRVSSAGKVEVDLWTAPGPFPRQLAAKIIADAVGARTVTRVLFKGDLKARNVTKVEVLGGPGMWEEQLDNHRYLVSAPSFFQVNTAAARQLRRVVAEALAPNGTDRVIDLFAGVGTFTLPLAEMADNVIAVESSRYAIADLRRNLEVNDIFAEIEPGDADRVLPALGRADLVVVDPPRGGLAESTVASLAATGARRIVYVSCDPTTLARDAARIVGYGYRPTEAVPVDLFPQTYHVETVLVLDAD